MRIRKHASRALSSTPIRTLSCAEEGDAELHPAGTDMETSLCRLNQSPWDALPPTPPESYLEILRMRGEGKEGFVWESTSIVLGDLPALSQYELSISTPGKKMEAKMERGREMEMKIEVENNEGYSRGPCSLGHRRQLDKNNSKKKMKKKMMKKKAKRKKRMKTEEREDGGENESVISRKNNPSSDIYVYYSGFAPGRGKRRRSSSRSSLEAGGGGGAEGAGFLPRVPARWLVEEDEEDDDVAGDLGRECGGDDVIEIKRTGRRPIKARFLSSLL